MIRDPQTPKSQLITDVMSGRNGTLIVIIVSVLCFAAASCAVFAAWQVNRAAKAAAATIAEAVDSTKILTQNDGITVSDPTGTVNPESAVLQAETQRTNPPQTKALVIEPPQTKAPVTEPPQTKASVTEPPQTKAPVTEPPQTKAPVTEPPQTKAPVTEPPQTKAPETEPPETKDPEPDKNVIVIDAGHGYDDPGTDADILGSWSEKDINLDTALRLGAILEAAGCEVAYTRKDDLIPENAPRNAEGYYLLNAYAREDFIKAQKNADAVVSLHCDSYEQDPEINGVRVFYYKYNSKYIAYFAADIAEGIENALMLKGKPEVTPPSVVWLGKEEAFYITKCTNIPSVLVEMGFVTNKTDVNHFLDADWRQEMAQGIADGILSFLGTE